MGSLWLRSCGRSDSTSLHWPFIEPKEGEFHFDRHDARVRDAGSRNLFPLGWVEFSDIPDYARSSNGYFDEKKYLDFLNRVVERYDGDGVDDMPGLQRPIKHWEIGNEVTMRTEFTGTPEDYGHVLQISYRAIKANCPDCQVLIAGWMTYANSLPAFQRSLNYLDKVLSHGGAESFDILSFHSYTSDCPFLTRAHVKGFSDLLARYGRKAPMWMTESDTMLRSKRGDGTVIEHSLRQQSEDLIKRAVIAFDAGVQVYFWHGFDDAIAGGPGFGFFDENQKPKPIFYNLRLLRERVGDRTNVERVELGEESLYFFKFSTQAHSSFVLWSESGDKTLDLAKYLKSPSVRLTWAITQTGKESPQTGKADIHEVPATKTPVFIEGDSSKT
jgi:hypothetical protein